MGFVRTHPPDQAGPVMQAQYDNTRKSLAMDEYSKLLTDWNLLPEVAGGWLAWHAGVRAKTGLTAVEYELMECRIMYLMKSAYVLVNHAALLSRISGFGIEQMRAYFTSPETSDLGVRTKAILRFAGRLATASHTTTAQDVEVLRANGFNEEQITALVWSIGSLSLNAILPNAFGTEFDEFSAPFRVLADWKG